MPRATDRAPPPALPPPRSSAYSRAASRSSTEPPIQAPIRHDQIHEHAPPHQAGGASSYQVPSPQGPRRSKPTGASRVTGDHKRVTNPADDVSTLGRRSGARSDVYHQQTKNLLVPYSPKKPGFFQGHESRCLIRGLSDQGTCLWTGVSRDVSVTTANAASSFPRIGPCAGPTAPAG